MDYCLLSKVGSRDVNEDSVGMLETEQGKCFVLCDGLGGHGKGEVASELVCSNVCEMFASSERSDEEFLKTAFEQSQQKLLSRQGETGSKFEMKTTAVVLLFDADKALWGHIGDSRLYVFNRFAKVKTRTVDHSVPQMLVLAKEIKEKDIRRHPDRNKLLRVMGNAGCDLKYDISAPLPLNRASAFLLCSDGFWENITEKQMSHLLKSAGSAEDWVTEMEQVVLETSKGTNLDNYSAIAIIT